MVSLAVSLAEESGGSADAERLKRVSTSFLAGSQLTLLGGRLWRLKRTATFGNVWKMSARLANNVPELTLVGCLNPRKATVDRLGR